MKPELRFFLLFSTGLLLGSAALAAPPAPVPAPASCDVTVTTADDGSVKLSNSADPRCDVPAAATPAAPAGAPEGVANRSPNDSPDEVMVRSTRASGRPFQNIPVAASADSGPGQPASQKDGREQYRDIMMQGNQGTTASNPAVSRRYKAMDKATYQATVLGGVAPGSQ